MYWLLSRSAERRVFATSAVVALLLFAAATIAQSSPPGDKSDGKNSKESADAGPVGSAASPIFGVKIPDGYRKWELVGVSQDPDVLKGIVGNEATLKAYRGGKQTFPDGSVFVKLSWKREPFEGFEGVYEPGAATTVQVMVKDSKKYASTGGWGFGRFINGKPANAAEHETCFECHSSTKKVREHDFVFTRLAP